MCNNRQNSTLSYKPPALIDFFLFFPSSISFKHFNAKFFGSDVIADGKIHSVFSENPDINGRFNIKEFNISTLNSLKNSKLLPTYIADTLNAYENYQGAANISLTVLL